jgi:hypothetical protein
MPSLNFQTQFVRLIESGKKRQTIRPLRKNPIKVGDKLYLFTGLRTKDCKTLVTPESFIWTYGLKDWIKSNGKLEENAKRGKYPKGKRPYVICKSVEKIRIDKYSLRTYNKKYKTDVIYNLGTMNIFAKKDGFKNENEFLNFFKNHYGLPFEGVLIKW